MGRVLTLDLTLGAIVVSTFFSFLAMGIILTTTLQYFANFQKDRLVFKLLVAAVFILSLVDTIADGYWSYEWTVTYYARPQIMAVLPVSLMIEMFCVGSTSLITQTFFAWRIWKISAQRNWVLPSFIAVMSVLQWSVVLWVVIYWSSHRAMADVGSVLPIGYAWLVSSVVADLTITVGMVYYLGIRPRGQGQPLRSKSTFNQIIARTVQSNVLALLSQIITFSLFKADIGLYFFLIDMITAKAYAFSLIISLITRENSSNTNYNTTDSAENSRPEFSLSNMSTGVRGARAAPTVSITVRRDVDVDHDSWDANQSYTAHKVDPEAGLTSTKDLKTEGGY